MQKKKIWAHLNKQPLLHPCGVLLAVEQSALVLRLADNALVCRSYGHIPSINFGLWWKWRCYKKFLTFFRKKPHTKIRCSWRDCLIEDNVMWSTGCSWESWFILGFQSTWINRGFNTFFYSVLKVRNQVTNKEMWTDVVTVGLIRNILNMPRLLAVVKSVMYKTTCCFTICWLGAVSQPLIRHGKNLEA